MPGLIPDEKVAPADPANQAQPGAPGTEAAPTESGAPPPDPAAGGDPTGAPDDGGGTGGLIPGQDAPDPTADQTAGPVGAAINNDGDDTPGMKGTVEDARNQAQDDDPYAEVDATPEEQAEYDQIVSRFLQFICDKNPPAHGGQAPAQIVLAQINKPGMPLAKALGMTAAHIVFTLVQGAKMQKVEYSSEVLIHASFEFVAALYLIASAAGIMKGMPPFKGMPEDGDYDFEDSEIKVITEAQMQATKEYGTMLVKTGNLSQDDRDSNNAFWKKQIAREVQQGNVSDDVISKLQSHGVFDKVHAQMGMDGHGQQPPSSDSSASAPPPSPDSAGTPTTPGSDSAAAAAANGTGGPASTAAAPPGDAAGAGAGGDAGNAAPALVPPGADPTGAQ